MHLAGGINKAPMDKTAFGLGMWGNVCGKESKLTRFESNVSIGRKLKSFWKGGLWPDV